MCSRTAFATSWTRFVEPSRARRAPKSHPPRPSERYKESYGPDQTMDRSGAAHHRHRVVRHGCAGALRLLLVPNADLAHHRDAARDHRLHLAVRRARRALVDDWRLAVDEPLRF